MSQLKLSKTEKAAGEATFSLEALLACASEGSKLCATHGKCTRSPDKTAILLWIESSAESRALRLFRQVHIDEASVRRRALA